MIFELFHKYSESSTCHGIKYIGRTNFYILERVFWFFASSLFIFLAATTVLTIWGKFSLKPIEISVKTTTFPLAEIPFPAVTVCPINLINVTIATKYLSRYINFPITLKHRTIKNVLSALYFLRYPNYIEMRKYLKMSRKHLKYFDNLNISDFMLAVLPTCDKIFKECIWHGKVMNCCEIFNIQRTEEGFCYSFNSFTSEDKKICFSNLSENKNEHEKCRRPEFLTFSGIYSGLTIFLGNEKADNKFFLQNQKHLSGVRVFLSSTYDIPKAGSGILLRSMHGESIEVEVEPSVLLSTKSLSRISKSDRDCMLDSEVDLLTKYYSQHSCHVACRHDFIKRMCGCQMYFFYDSQNSSKPLCKLNQLQCITKYADSLTLKPPSKYAFHTPLIKDYPDCDCKTACEAIWYDLIVKRKNISELMGRNVTGHLDIYYKKYGAIKYERKLAFTSENLITNLGGVVNLFLGASFISISEVLYYFTRSTFILIYQKIIASAETSGGGIVPTEFIN